MTDMILDRGICWIYRKVNTAEPGAMPVWVDDVYHVSWYGELNFETNPARPTDNREEVKTDARIRILQNRRINNHDRVLLKTVEGEETMYEVTRAYHGADDESGELITDLTLEVYEP